jgi:putative zinc finger/helix-turn-helix YgiT family protein
MNEEIFCQVCESSETATETYADLVEFKGIELQANGLMRTRCNHCGYVFATSEQHDRNVDVVRASFIAQRSAAKREMGRLTGEEIRAIRQGLGLSQQEAGELFGGSVNTFSRYEIEEVVQPASVDGFLRLAALLGVKGLPVIRASKGVTKIRQNDVAMVVSPAYNGLNVVNCSITTVDKNARHVTHFQKVGLVGSGAHAESGFVSNPLTGAMARVGN